MNGQVVEQIEIGSCDEEVDDAASPESAVLEGPECDGGALAHQPLIDEKSNDDKEKADDESDDPGIIPSVLNAVPQEDHEDLITDPRISTVPSQSMRMIRCQIVSSWGILGVLRNN